MRLLNLNTLELRDFIDSERPPYVILSHTWEAEEVSLQELHGPSVEKMAGYGKLLNFCRQGSKNGFRWGWADTCCIDKTSSAELSEAINSMYRWYQEADICYAFLNDVFPNQEQPSKGIEDPVAWSRWHPKSTKDQFALSRWFTRGWTLQELLAPSSVVFYRRDWSVYGTKSTLRMEISRITDIPEAALTNPKSLGNYNVAQKISWASNRQTTRPEDLSYCLLGLLGVHMPLLYGEGTRAFIRLQEEVMKTGNDPTIFAWPSSAIKPGTEDSLSLLAPSPAAFKDASNIRGLLDTSSDPNFGPWSTTNRGIRIEGLPLLKKSEAKKLLAAADFHLLQTVLRQLHLFTATERGFLHKLALLFTRSGIYTTAFASLKVFCS